MGLVGWSLGSYQVQGVLGETLSLLPQEVFACALLSIFLAKGMDPKPGVALLEMTAHYDMTSTRNLVLPYLP